MTKTSRCPVCDAADTFVFLRRADVPVHQNVVVRSELEARSTARGNLELRACEMCGFVFNDAFELERVGYGPDYDNTQTHSAFFREHVEGLIRTLVDEKGVRGARIVEVGSGNGDFLQALVLADEGNVGYGFDPSYRGEEEQLGGRLRFLRSYYDEACASIPADVVVARHLIEHVPDPVALLRTIRGALANSPHARVFFETPCVEWILENEVFWDFFYEHCSIFTAASLRTAFEAAGFRVDAVKHVFGGQYLWLEASIAAACGEVTRDAGRVPELARSFATAENALREEWSAKLRDLRARGPVALWGAGAKGVTCANLIDPRREVIDCVVDLNPQKQGHYIPGTGHPIVGPPALAARGVASAILLNPNYRQENLALLREAGLAVELV